MKIWITYYNGIANVWAGNQPEFFGCWCGDNNTTNLSDICLDNVCEAFELNYGEGQYDDSCILIDCQTEDVWEYYDE